jgi:GNAT superfamily N-acetyltransferase
VRLAEIHTFAWRWAYRGLVPDRELYLDRTVAKAVDQWTKMLASGTRVLVWDDGIPKGFVIHGKSRDSDNADAWEVMALYVDPPFFREGGGSALLGASEQLARDEGYRKSLLWVLEANSRARAFYDTQGYRQDGESKVIEEWAGAVELRYLKEF